MTIIIPFPSNDNGNLMKLLESSGFIFTITSQSISSIVKSIYDPTSEVTSSSPGPSSNIAKTIIIDGRNNEICSRLLTLGYSNYSVTVKSYYDLIFELFERHFPNQNESRHSHPPTLCSNEEMSDDDGDYYSARQSPEPGYCNIQDASFDNEEYYYAESDYSEPKPKRSKHHIKYPGMNCGCMQQCQICKKHVLGEHNFSSNDIILHAFYHTKMNRFRCATCGMEWRHRPKYHKFGCTEKKIIDITEPQNIPSSLFDLSLKCLPAAIEELKEKGQWNL